MKCKEPNCDVTECERATAKRLNMHPEDVHYIMDIHMQTIADVAKERRERFKD